MKLTSGYKHVRADMGLPLIQDKGAANDKEGRALVAGQRVLWILL